ncbi:ABSCISIC ACID-INSENSITIVE 5-like protein 3 [Magnolia sinica]|uniref:ABSCISIC ACID-INSENSITIVE 5-like protein 3 n=1 Tax=Magnolia sinica TaxID=86752 RepID=UPI00265A9E29|nr:ABSCISIC ACID-INSENSITIVE 5-like protein 3 [Magnolia sinica]
MGFRTMVSPDRGQAPHIPSLARQGSLYNLTLDELQNQLGDLGKPLNNMNLDELLKSVIAAEENQLLQASQIGSSNADASSSSASLVPGNSDFNQSLNQKTLDEVWKDIVQNDQENVGGDGPVQRQPTLGEMTLEDFLVRAGAINLGNQNMATVNTQPLMSIEPTIATTQRADWLHYQMVQQQQMAVLGLSLPVPAPVFGKSGVDVGYGENQLALTTTMPMVGATSSDLQAVAERKRKFPEEMLEKSIERRQKRMIKNRESAARSRARKQAYTNQLETEVSNLRKKNTLLKKQTEFNTLLPSNQTQEPTYQLRRTSSAPF